jgi:hypothetical protein
MVWKLFDKIVSTAMFYSKDLFIVSTEAFDTIWSSHLWLLLDTLTHQLYFLYLTKEIS